MYTYHFFLGMFFFSCIWSIGAVCDSETKKKFNLIFTELLKGELSDDVQKSLQLGNLEVPPLETPYVFPPPKECDVFSYKVYFFLDLNFLVRIHIKNNIKLYIQLTNSLSISARHWNKTRMEKMGRGHWRLSSTSERYLRLSAHHSNCRHGQVLLSYELVRR